jgi:hypothetical protein
MSICHDILTVKMYAYTASSYGQPRIDASMHAAHSARGRTCHISVAPILV